MLVLSSDRELPTVLLIDDDLVSREVTATLLTMNGYTVHTAENGAASLTMLAAGLCDPGVILVDAQMPGISGVELIKELRSTCHRARIYVISGSGPAPEIVSASDGLLLKPFDNDALRKLLEGGQRTAPSYLDPSDPVVSSEVLSKLRQMMPEAAVREIYTATAADLTRRIEALSRAIARRDSDEIHRIGHAIKGGCGMAGAVQAARLGAKLEIAPSAAEDNHLDNSKALLRDLRNAAQALQSMLDAELPA
jgi:CheY-like chemotaxis protein